MYRHGVMKAIQDWDLRLSFDMGNLDGKSRNMREDLSLTQGYARWSLLFCRFGSSVIVAHSTHLPEMQERMCQPYRRSGHYFIGNLEMDIERIAQQLSQIVDVVCDVGAEVKNYGDDTQFRMQDIADKLQSVLDWCEGVALTLNILLPLMPKGTCSNIPILAPRGPDT